MTVRYIPGAEPFCIPGNRIGCLLLHGLTATPQEMRELGTRLNAQGYTILAPALAGHATQVQDMVPTRWGNWYRAACVAYNQLREQCDTIFLIGRSLDGVLSLHLAAQRKASGVIAIAAPSAVNLASTLTLKAQSPLAFLIPILTKSVAKSDPQDRNVFTNHIRYNAWPTRAGINMICDLFPHVMNNLRDVIAPAPLLQARGDHTIPKRAMAEIYASLNSHDKEMVWLERGRHLVTQDYDKEIAFELIRRFIASHLPSDIARPARSYPDLVARATEAEPLARRIRRKAI
jgi:carboxylesterase